MGPNGDEGKYILGACVHVDISCKEDYLCAHVRVLSLWISTWARKCPEEAGWACYGVMSGLISQLCLRLITQRPLGGGNREKKRRGGDEKATWGALTTVSASSPPLPRWERDKTLIRAHAQHSRPHINLLPVLYASRRITQRRRHTSCLLKHLTEDKKCGLKLHWCNLRIGRKKSFRLLDTSHLSHEVVFNKKCD